MSKYNAYFNPGNVMPELDASLLQMAGPAVEEVLPHHLIKVTSVCHEGRREQDITQDGRHLHLEGLTTSLPAFSLNGQAA